MLISTCSSPALVYRRMALFANQVINEKEKKKSRTSWLRLLPMERTKKEELLKHTNPVHRETTRNRSIVGEYFPESARPGRNREKRSSPGHLFAKSNKTCHSCSWLNSCIKWSREQKQRRSSTGSSKLLMEKRVGLFPVEVQRISGMDGWMCPAGGGYSPWPKQWSGMWDISGKAWGFLDWMQRRFSETATEREREMCVEMVQEKFVESRLLPEA